MLYSILFYQDLRLIFSLLFSASLMSACGGGSESIDTAATSSAGDSVAVSTTPSAASVSGTLQSGAEALGNMDQQHATMAFALAATPTIVDTQPRRSYYIDSRTGDDSNDGKAAAAAAAGVGPWKTLARVMRASLVAGDSIRLVCGSTWAETLQLPTSGVVGKPLVVTSYPGACTTPPVIDGGAALANGGWTQYGSGSIYRIALETAPLQVSAENGVMTVAHFPNRGADAAVPTSMYLRTAADSDSIITDGRASSTYLISGFDLPSGKVTVGTKVRIRSNSWTLEDNTVAAVGGSRITLSSPTRFPVKSGWGYFFIGQAWMLDSPGEWFYDSGAKMLYAWMADSGVPRRVVSTQLPIGVDLTSRKYVTLNNLIIKQVGTGIAMSGSTGVIVQYVSVRDTSGTGIDAARGTGNTITYTSLVRTGGDAISAPDAIGMKVLYNTVNQSGVLVTSDVVQSVPSMSYAGIRPGTQGEVTGNTVIDTGYIGIWPGAGTTVTSNYVSGACSVLDDCGGIYASQPNHNGVISGNFVEHSRGAIEGKNNSSSPRTQAQGIYLDEGASGVIVDGNTVIDTDNGIQLHIAANNTIKNNKLYGNRNNQIWLQETSNKVRTTGDVFGNVVSNNQIVPTSSTARGFLLETMINNSELFAQLDWNRYFDRTYSRVGSDLNPSTRADYTLADWKAASKADGTPRNQDKNASGASEVRLASWMIAGSNIVPNASLLTEMTGWGAYNDGKVQVPIYRKTCAAGYCLQYTAGSVAGLVNSPNFSVVAGQWYRVSLDLQGGRDNQSLNLIVRRSGGGTNGYESLMSPSLTVALSNTMKRYSFTFQATKTVNANDPVTLDKGARFDTQQIQPGDQVVLANLSIVPITASAIGTRTDIMKNTTLVSVQTACPVAATTPAMCSSYARMSDDSAVTWPITLAARSSEIVYTRDASLVDTDGDGIADSQDACPGTTQGLQVDASGCALGQ